MLVDLSHKNVVELRFGSETPADDPCASANTEAAASVHALDASHNRITRVLGLESLFTNLVELRLAHNALGVSSTPADVARQHARHMAVMAGRLGWDRWVAEQRCCRGNPSWIDALPRTLELLDVSYNQLSSFISCTCGQSPPRQLGGLAAVSTVAEARLSYLRHACPFTVSLFFPEAKHPRLQRLNCSHNALAVSLRESDEMGRIWQREVEGDDDRLGQATRCAATEIDLSFNPGLAAVNCFLLCSSEWSSPSSAGDEVDPGLRTLSLAETGIDDLVAASDVSFFAPQLSTLQLYPTPLSRAVGNASAMVLADFLASLILPALMGERRPDLVADDVVAVQFPLSSSFERMAVKKAFDDLTTHHLPDLEQMLRQRVCHVNGAAAHPLRRGGGSLATMSMFVYATLLLEVIPSLKVVDGGLHVRECKDAMIAAVQASLLLRCKGSATVSGGSPAITNTAPTTQLRRQPSLSSLAAVVTPQLRPKVIVQGDGVVERTKPSVGNGGLPSNYHAEPLGEVQHLGEREPQSSGASDEADSLQDREQPVNRFQATLDALQPFTRGKGPAASIPASESEMARADDAATVSIMDRSLENGTMECFTPVSLLFAPSEKARYEALCMEAQRLEDDLLRANQRRQALSTALVELKNQLASDRKLISDQRKGTVALRDRRDTLQQRVQAQQAKLRKRQKEIAYGVGAMRSQAKTAKEKERTRQLEERERALEKKERLWKRRVSRMGALAVNYNQHLDAAVNAERKPLRSVVLREAATRVKLEQMESKEPLAYSASRFHEPPKRDGAAPARKKSGSQRTSRREARSEDVGASPPPRKRSPSPSQQAGSRSDHSPRHRSGSRHSTDSIREMLERDEGPYFQKYFCSEDGGDEADADFVGASDELQRTATDYCQRLSPERQRQLQGAVESAVSHSPFSGNSQRGSRGSSHVYSPRELPPKRPDESSRQTALRPPPPFPGPLSPPTPPFPPSHVVHPLQTDDAALSHAPSPASVRDLSTLSLTELFEAAASIRRRQLALQQLQEEWQEQKRASPSATVSPSKRRKEEASPLPVISPATPQPLTAPLDRELAETGDNGDAAPHCQTDSQRTNLPPLTAPVGALVQASTPDSAPPLESLENDAPSSVSAAEDEEEGVQSAPCLLRNTSAIGQADMHARAQNAVEDFTKSAFSPDLSDAPATNRALFS